MTPTNEQTLPATGVLLGSRCQTWFGLSALTIENLKCFAEKTTIPLAPLTLIYGENSGGKSTVLLALRLLRDTVLSGCKSDAMSVPFRDVVTGRNVGRRVSLGCCRRDRVTIGENELFATHVVSVGVEIAWQAEHSRPEVSALHVQYPASDSQNDEFVPHPALRRWDFLRQGGRLSCSIDLGSLSGDAVDCYLYKVDAPVPKYSEVITADVETFLLHSMGDRVDSIREGVARLIERDLMQTFLDERPDEGHRFVIEAETVRLAEGRLVKGNWFREPASQEATPEKRAAKEADLLRAKAAIEGWRNGLPEWIQSCPPGWRDFRQTSDYATKSEILRSTKYREVLAFCEHPNASCIRNSTATLSFADGNMANPEYTASPLIQVAVDALQDLSVGLDWDDIHYREPWARTWPRTTRSEEPKDVNGPCSLKSLMAVLDRMISTEYKAHLPWDVARGVPSLVEIAPLRERSERVYLRAGQGSGASQSAATAAPMLLAENKDSLLVRVNEWLARLGVDYEVQIASSKDESFQGYFQVLLKDTRNPDLPPVNYADVGFGVSQVLPILVAGLSGEDRIILVEQPELHIHPRLQAELGSFFAECIRERGHQFIIETHSEHLMLRVQRLLRNGQGAAATAVGGERPSLPVPLLKSEDVCVLYVSRGEGGSSVQRLSLDAEGDFLDPWPGGFFPERLGEVL